jgi:hypothetical protein
MVHQMPSSSPRPARLEMPERTALSLLALASVIVIPEALNRFVY